MPTARENLLEAAHAAAMRRPWREIRMVDVATAAGVSRQTLYNEFGTKEGLGAAMVDALVAGFLAEAAGAAAEAGRGGADPADCCAAAAARMLRTAREEPLVRAALTGGPDPRMPLPAPAGPAPDGRDPGVPGRLAEALCARVVAGLTQLGRPYPYGLERACEAGMRVALSYVVAPLDVAGAGDGKAPVEETAGTDGEACERTCQVVRALLAQDTGGQARVSAPRPRAAARSRRG